MTPCAPRPAPIRCFAVIVLAVVLAEVAFATPPSPVAQAPNSPAARAPNSPAAQAPTRANCAAAIAQARAAIVVLAPGTMSRKFADFDLVQAAAEAGNGEFDDCLDYAGNALDEAHHPQHLGEAAAAARNPPP